MEECGGLFGRIGRWRIMVDFDGQSRTCWWNSLLEPVFRCKLSVMQCSRSSTDSRHIVGPRYQKAPVSFLTEALILSFAILLFALLPLSVRDRRSGRHAKFGQFSRVAYLSDEPGVRSDAR